jgi:hypothetical protein
VNGERRTRREKQGEKYMNGERRDETRKTRRERMMRLRVEVLTVSERHTVGMG